MLKSIIKKEMELHGHNVPFLSKQKEIDIKEQTLYKFFREEDNGTLKIAEILMKYYRLKVIKELS